MATLCGEATRKLADSLWLSQTGCHEDASLPARSKIGRSANVKGGGRQSAASIGLTADSRRLPCLSPSRHRNLDDRNLAKFNDTGFELGAASCRRRRRPSRWRVPEKGGRQADSCQVGTRGRLADFCASVELRRPSGIASRRRRLLATGLCELAWKRRKISAWARSSGFGSAPRRGSS